MQLSRVQDLAGARIMVRDFAAQDACKDEVSQFYAGQGHACKVIDRRIDPRFGYRAVHIVVRIDEILVEIQIRTELQDSWAQIVERLADRWGRGIRYGQDPEHPDALVRSGDSSFSRRESVQRLMGLSDSIFSLEGLRQRVEKLHQETRMMASQVDSMRDAAHSVMSLKVTPPFFEFRAKIAELITQHQDLIDPECQALLNKENNITIAEFVRMNAIFADIMRREIEAVSADLASTEQDVRDRLGVVVNAVDEGE
jgi:ppGpp synthetase/RelA/SpoT-type nucleotidyltranferase